MKCRYWERTTYLIMKFVATSDPLLPGIKNWDSHICELLQIDSIYLKQQNEWAAVGHFWKPFILYKLDRDVFRKISQFNIFLNIQYV